MEKDGKTLRIIGLIEFIVGLFFAIIVAARITSLFDTPADATVTRIIACIVGLIIGCLLLLYGLKEYHDNSDTALLPIFFWGVAIVGIAAVSVSEIIAVVQEPSIGILVIAVIEIVAFLGLGIPIIRAYIKKSASIIPLCIGFSILYILGTVVEMASRILYGEGYSWAVIVFRYLWGTGWLLYFLFSNKINAIYPNETRIKPKWMTWLLAIYAFLGLCIIALSYFGEKTPEAFASEYSLEEIVSATNEQLPTDNGDGSYLEHIDLDGNRVLYSNVIPGIIYSDLGEDAFKMYGLELEEIIRASVATSEDNGIYNYCKDGYSVINEYKDTTGVMLYSYTITPSDYSDLKNQSGGYRTDDDRLTWLLNYHKENVPFDLFSDISVDIFDFDKTNKQLTYQLRLPYTDDLNQYSKNYLQGLLTKNWYAIDNTLTLAGINGYECKFIVKTSTGLNWTNFSISAPAFNND